MAITYHFTNELNDLNFGLKPINPRSNLCVTDKDKDLAFYFVFPGIRNGTNDWFDLPEGEMKTLETFKKPYLVVVDCLANNKIDKVFILDVSKTNKGSFIKKLKERSPVRASNPKKGRWSCDVVENGISLRTPKELFPIDNIFIHKNLSEAFKNVSLQISSREESINKKKNHAKTKSIEKSKSASSHFRAFLKYKKNESH